MEIKKLRDGGMSDAQIIAEHSNLQAGYVWLKENPGFDAKAEKPKQPVGSGSMPANPQARQSYGAEFRTPQLS
ncbi:hypothetical protein H0W80_04595 [Candidatus Saccharibacteria bacterium]|nr:hypothetical protein [Candidatus Saccharibacteria bacterium]